MERDKLQSGKPAAYNFKNLSDDVSLWRCKVKCNALRKCRSHGYVNAVFMKASNPEKPCVETAFSYRDPKKLELKPR